MAQKSLSAKEKPLSLKAEIDMTQTQKIIATALGVKDISSGTRVYISEQSDGISFYEPICGAFGKLFIKDKIFTVPESIFIDLTAPLRYDVTSEEIAEYIKTVLSKKDITAKALEFGGDSMTYLTMDDRIEIVKALSECEKKPFCVIFEYDYITAEYTLEHFSKKPVTFFNDGPQFFEEVISLALDKA